MLTERQIAARAVLLGRKWDNEDQMTSDLFQYTFNYHPALRGLFFHVPNGGARSMQEGAKFKAMGVTPGEPDFVNMYRVPCGVELKMEKERKTKNGGLSPDQMMVHAQWRAAGREVYIAYTAEEYLSILDNHIL